MTTTIYSKDKYTILSRNGIANVLFNTITNQHSLHANTAFNTGDIIVSFSAATTQNYASYLTLQTGRGIHITLEPSFLQYVNHSCNPNVFFDTSAMQLVCISRVNRGDELCFFYPSAEWEMAQPFVCNCNSKNCLQLINGARGLGAETIGKHRFTDFIEEQIKQKR